MAYHQQYVINAQMQQQVVQQQDPQMQVRMVST